MKRILTVGAVVVLAAGAVLGGTKLQQVLMVGAGYYAKMLCSGVFVSQRPADAVIAEDVLADQSEALQLYTSDISEEDGSVAVSALGGFAAQRARYLDGYGCHLELGDDRVDPPAIAPIAAPPADAPWPEGARAVPDTLQDDAQAALDAALDDAFAETDPQRAKRTRAIAVVHRGRLVAERYADGFTAETPQLGWSMAKSVTNALAGALAARGEIGVERPAAVTQWQAEDDPRAEISLDNLLRMSSGLEFDESYDGMLSDVRVMLFARGDKAGFAADKPLACPPGTCWYYSSGTSNIVSAVLQGAAGGGADLAHELLFTPLGLHTAVFELDAAGTLVASSYVYASARDWARLGLLYQRGGDWFGEQIFSRDWLEYTLEPSSGNAGFGAHVWLAPPSWNDREAARAIPEDDFYFLGHDGQMVAIIPSRETVIVRLGLTRIQGPFDHAVLVRSILDALPE